MYLSFCEFYGFNPYPTDTDILYLQLERYNTYRLHCGQGTYSTIMNDTSAIQHHLACQGIHSNVRNDHTPWKKILKTASREFPSKSQASEGIPVHQFAKIMKEIPPDSIDACVIRTLFTLAFSTGLRGAEFIPDKQLPLQRKQKQLLLRRDRVFTWEDPEDPATHLAVIWFFDSKTNKAGDKPAYWKQEFATVPCTCKLGFCAVKELIRLISLIKDCKPETLIFTWANGTLVTRRQWRNILRNTASKAGLLIKRLGTHSTRKACILYAMKCNTPDSILVQIGRWKSFNSIRPYINLPPLELIETRKKQSSISDSIKKQRFRMFSNNNGLFKK